MPKLRACCAEAQTAGRARAAGLHRCIAAARTAATPVRTALFSLPRLIFCLDAHELVCALRFHFPTCALPIPAPLVGEGIPSPNSQFWCGESLPLAFRIPHQGSWCGIPQQGFYPRCVEASHTKDFHPKSPCVGLLTKAGVVGDYG